MQHCQREQRELHLRRQRPYPSSGGYGDQQKAHRSGSEGTGHQRGGTDGDSGDPRAFGPYPGSGRVQQEIRDSHLCVAGNH